MTAARIRTIRLCLLVAACLLLAAIWHELALYLFASFAWVPLGLFMPVFPVGCLIWEDYFASNQIDESYEERSGDWTVSGGKLLTSDDNALLIANASGSEGHGQTYVDCTLSGDGQMARLIGSYVDDDNYIFCQFKRVNSDLHNEFSLWSRSGGVTTQIGQTIEIDGVGMMGASMRLCWDGTHVTSSVLVGFSQWGYYESYSGTGNKVGVGASGGTVQFDNLLFYRHRSHNEACFECKNPKCEYCQELTYFTKDSDAQLTLIDVGEAPFPETAHCDDCPDLNTTYLLSAMASATAACVGIFACEPQDDCLDLECIDVFGPGHLRGIRVEAALQTNKLRVRVIAGGQSDALGPEFTYGVHILEGEAALTTPVNCDTVSVEVPVTRDWTFLAGDGFCTWSPASGTFLLNP